MFYVPKADDAAPIKKAVTASSVHVDDIPAAVSHSDGELSDKDYYWSD